MWWCWRLRRRHCEHGGSSFGIGAARPIRLLCGLAASGMAANTFDIVTYLTTLKTPPFLHGAAIIHHCFVISIAITKPRPRSSDELSLTLACLGPVPQIDRWQLCCPLLLEYLSCYPLALVTPPILYSAVKAREQRSLFPSAGSVAVCSKSSATWHGPVLCRRSIIPSFLFTFEPRLDLILIGVF